MSVIGSNILAGASGAAGGAAGGYQIERSLRFEGNTTTPYLIKNDYAADSNRQTFTLSLWVKKSATVSNQRLFGLSGTNQFSVMFNGNDQLSFYAVLSTGTAAFDSAAKYRDFSAWYHIVLAFDTTASGADKMKVYVNGEEISFASIGLPADNATFYWGDSTLSHYIGRYSSGSLYFYNGYMADIHYVDGQQLNQYDFGEFDANGVWQPIEYTGTYGTNGFHLDFSDNSSASALGTDSSGNGNDWTAVGFAVNNSDQVYSSGASYEGNAVLFSNEPAGAFGKPGISDWGVTYSPSGSTSLTSGGKVTFPSAITNVSSVVISYRVSGGSGSVYINDNSTGVIGLNSTSSVEVDVTAALAGSSTPNTFSSIVFGPSSASYGMRLNYIKVNGVILNDSTYNYLNDSLLDSPTNGTQTDTGAGGEVSGNYATLNPLATQKSGSITLSDGNLTATVGATRTSAYASFPFVGKMYYEVTFRNTAYIFGMAPAVDFNSAANTAPQRFIGESSVSYGVVTSNTVYNNGVSIGTISDTFTVGDCMGWAYDSDSGQITIFKNGTNVGTFTASTSRTYFPAITLSGSGAVADVNFGQRPFAYTAPSGFKALCTANLDDPTILDGSTAMDVVTYTGNGGTQTISGLEFSPDLVWIKNRAGVYSHLWFDQIRGTTKYLRSDHSGNEGTDVNSLTAFTEDGFTVGSTNASNLSGGGIVAWAWKGGGTAVSNASGSIASSVSANPSAGFSIVSYTGDGNASATIGHGLNAAPEFIIVKNRDIADEGSVYHVNVESVNPQDYYIRLFSTSNGTAASSNLGAMWNDTAPTSSVFSIGTEDQVNALNEKYIAYCWTSIEGYSKVGNYKGNGQNDGTFVYTGFRPRFIMWKRSNLTTSWTMYDTERQSGSLNGILYPNLNNQENLTTNIVDILSNGFKLRVNSANYNSLNDNYIYVAFAENPFKTARAR